jgi:ElaB/YqjD/DUF883 family membrane-anchored ribosome-binding protein
MNRIEIANVESRKLDDAKAFEDESLQKLGALKESFAALMQEMPDLPAQVRAAVHDLGGKIGSLYDVAAEGAEDAVDAVDEAISEHPWVGFWIGVAAGVTAFQIFRRIRQD